MNTWSVAWTALNSVPHRTEIEPIAASTEEEKKKTNIFCDWLSKVAKVIAVIWRINSFVSPEMTHQAGNVTYIWQFGE